MVEKDDWRLLNNINHLYNQSINPTNGKNIIKYIPKLKRCIFCWNYVKNVSYQYWYLPLDKSCCIREVCYYDFKNIFHWKLLDGWDIEW